jgi:excisionase family DNA binding protein
MNEEDNFQVGGGNAERPSGFSLLRLVIRRKKNLISFIAVVAFVSNNAILEKRRPKVPGATAPSKISGISQQAKTALKTLTGKSSGRKRKRGFRVVYDSGNARDAVTIPPAAGDLLLEILEQMANGVEVAVVAIDAELTTQEAANSLNVSRPHLIKLLDSGHIACRRVGAHRRIKVRDLLEYKRREQARSMAALAELASEAQKHNLGY